MLRVLRQLRAECIHSWLRRSWCRGWPQPRLAWLSPCRLWSSREVGRKYIPEPDGRKRMSLRLPTIDTPCLESGNILAMALAANQAVGQNDILIGLPSNLTDRISCLSLISMFRHRRQHAGAGREFQSQRALGVIPCHLNAHPLPFAVVEGNAVIFVEQERTVGSGIDQNRQGLID